MELEIWSDVACPFCYIGKRQIEAALERFDHRDDVHVRWRSFQLDPTTPKVVDGTIDELLAKKYGRSVEAHEMNARVIGMAEGVGLRYDFAALKPSNTYDAHRVIQLARERGVQDAVKERLLRGYFVDGERLSDHATLARLAGEAGLDADEVARTLADERAYAADVDADLELAREFGLSGVPSFVIDRRYLVTGAQPAEALVAALDQAWAERQPA